MPEYYRVLFFRQGSKAAIGSSLIAARSRGEARRLAASERDARGADWFDLED